MAGISSISNTAAMLDVIEAVDALLNAEEVQDKLLQALDTHELVKALNRVTGSHENLSPKLLEALEALRKFCYSIQAETLASVILEKCQAEILESADADLTAVVSEALDQALKDCLTDSSNDELNKAARSLAEAQSLYDLSCQLRPEAVETPPETMLREQSTRCTELLESIMSPQ